MLVLGAAVWPGSSQATDRGQSWGLGTPALENILKLTSYKGRAGGLRPVASDGEGRGGAMHHGRGGAQGGSDGPGPGH